MPQCKFIKPNGQRCRHRINPGQEYCHEHHPDRKVCAQPGCTKTAMTGLDYCQSHRKDGIPPTGFVHGHKTCRFRSKSGFRTQPLTPNKLVDTILRLEMLFTYADQVTDPKEYKTVATYLSHLQSRLKRALEKSDLTAAELEALIEEEKTKAWARFQAEQQEHQNLIKKPTSPLFRNPLYHQILDYLHIYINRHKQSPTYRQIRNALGISMSTVQHYLSQLEEDEKIHRLKAYPTQGRIIRLGPPQAKQLKLF